MSECPICLETVVAARSLVLECGHHVCVKCCPEWLLRNNTCPLCRAPSFVMSRATRSSARRGHVLLQLWMGIRRARNMECQCWYHGPLCPAKEVRLVLDRLVLSEKHVWRRADMRDDLEDLKGYCRDLCTVIDTVPLTPETIRLKDTLSTVIDIY